MIFTVIYNKTWFCKIIEKNGGINGYGMYGRTVSGFSEKEEKSEATISKYAYELQMFLQF